MDNDEKGQELSHLSENACSTHWGENEKVLVKMILLIYNIEHWIFQYESWSVGQKSDKGNGEI